jgi:hypothetical protein
MWRTLKEAELHYLQMQRLKQVPTENTVGAIHLQCCSNNKLTVAEFGDVMKTSIMNGLAFRYIYIYIYIYIYMALTVKKTVLVFWTIYIPSRNLMCLHLILPKVTLGKLLTGLTAVLMLHGKNRKWVLPYLMMTQKYSLQHKSVPSLPKSCFVLPTVIHTRHVCHLKQHYQPVPSYTSKSAVIQNILLPTLLRCW